MRTTILLGAGASVEAGLPDAFTATRQIYDKLSDDSKLQASYVIHALRFQHSRRRVLPRFPNLTGVEREGDASPLDYDVPIDMEEFVETVRMIAARRNLEVSAFVHEWDETIEVFEKGWGSNTFNRFSETIARKLSDLFLLRRNDGSRVRYLAPLLTRGPGSSIFTLNYDNTVEVLAQELGSKIDLRIDAWTRDRKGTLCTDAVNLIKLHGSLDWRRAADGSIERIPEDDLKEGNPDPCIVFGRGNKLTAEGPFLDFLGLLKHELSMSSIVLIVGYSFRDGHINEYLRTWWNSGMRYKVIVVGRSIERLRKTLQSVKVFGEDLERRGIVLLGAGTEAGLKQWASGAR